MDSCRRLSGKAAAIPPDGLRTEISRRPTGKPGTGDPHCNQEAQTRVRRWIRIASRLYPSRWRRRYGAEFDALLEDTRPTLKNALDVAWGALEMHMKMLTFSKLAVLCGVSGAILAAVMAVRMPGKYVSEAVIRVSGDAQSVRLFRDRVLPRALTPKHDISITNPNSRAGRPNEFDFTVRYSDRDAAQAEITGHQIVSRIVKASLLEGIKASARTQVRLLSPLKLTDTVVRPNRPLVTALGFGAGLALASLLAAAKQLLRRVRPAGSY